MSLDLAAIRDSLPVHYFDCERFNVTDYGTRQGKCDCTATADVTALLAEAERLRDTARDLEPRIRTALIEYGEDPKVAAVVANGAVSPPLTVGVGNGSGQVRDE